jgi:hypothetical protein
VRLRRERIDEAAHDGQLLLAEAQRDGDREQIQALNEQLNQLREERNAVDKEMESPAQAVGVRRN